MGTRRIYDKPLETLIKGRNCGGYPSALKASIVAITADRAHARGDGPQRQDCERQDEDQGRAHFSSDGAARPSAMSRRPSTRPNARIIAGQSIRAILVAPIFAHTSAGTA